MMSKTRLLLAAVLLVGSTAAPFAGAAARYDARRGQRQGFQHNFRADRGGGWRGGGWRGRGGGGDAVAAGVLGGIIGLGIGAAIAPRPYGPAYAPPPVAYGPGYGYYGY